jgi:hypothetical protein
MFPQNINFQWTTRRYIPEDGTAERTSEPTYLFYSFNIVVYDFEAHLKQVTYI